MASRFVWVPIGLFVAWSVVAHRWYVCHIKLACGAPEASVQVSPLEPDAALASAAVTGEEIGTDGPEPAKAADDRPLVFLWNTPTPRTGAGFSEFRSKLIDALPEGHAIEITGLHFPGEPAPEGFMNMGLARAAQIRALLVPPLGAHQVVASSRFVDSLPAGAQDGSGFVAAEFGVRAPSRRVLADGEPGVFDSRAEILFPYGSDAAQVDPAVDEFLSRLAEHLQKANAAVTIVGHTDSKGTAAFNQRLGLERAEHVRDLLVGRGVAAARVRVLSEGSASPVTSNETEEGRSRNRRVEILLQDSADGDG